MAFIAENQLFLLVGCFLLGTVGTVFLFRKPAGHNYWKLADLIWVVLGGFGALVAVFAGIYQDDNSQINRQIDIAYAATSSFDRDASRFRLRFCDPVGEDADVAILCDKVEFLSASTATNSALPLFISLTAEIAPLRGINFFGGNRMSSGEEQAMVQKANNIDLNSFLVFQPEDENTRSAVANLQQRNSPIAGDFVVLAGAYADLVSKVSLLQAEWQYLQSNAHILIIRIFALCLVGFAAPFRLGKSIVELR